MGESDIQSSANYSAHRALRTNDFLPALNAVLNGSAAVLLILGYIFIKSKMPIAHRNTMILAFLTSSAFLTSYLYYHFKFDARHYVGSGFFRGMYFGMLFTHIVGAIVLVPGVLRLFYHASRFHWIAHRRLARWVWPLWLYTSVTGVVIYFSLYGVGSS